MRNSLIPQSKFLSLILRHDPSVVGLTLDDAGWVDVDTLLDAIRNHEKQDLSRGKKPIFTREILDEIVATNEKRRFAFSPDGKRIRASQGHSIGIALGLEPTVPPDLLYHGTADRNLSSIREQGLIRGQRDHVHLSLDEPTARMVGMRHGKPIILTIRAAEMAAAGHDFYLADNGVWLTHGVPPVFISFPD